MRRSLAALLAVLLILCLCAAVLAFGAVNVGYAAPSFALAILMAIGWTTKLLLTRPVSWKYSPMHWPVVLFVLYTVYRYATSPVEYESRLELFRVLLYAFIYFFVTCNFYRSRDRSLLVASLITLAIAECLYAFWQFGTKATTVLHLIRPEQYQHRGGGTYVCPNHLAGFLEIVLALLLARIAIMRSSRSLQKSALKKVFTTYGALILLAGLVVTFSRAGWVALIVGIITFLFLRGWEPRTLWPRVAVGATGLVLILIIGLKFQPVRDYVHVSLAQKAERGELSRDPSMGSRVAMWNSSWNMVTDYPALGAGPGIWKWRFLEYRDPSLQFKPDFAHNDYLQLASEYGLVGVLIVAAFLATFFWHALKLLGPDNHSDERSFAMGTVTAMVMILVHSFFDFNMQIPANVLLLLTLAGTMAAMDDSEKRFPRTEMIGWQRVGLSLLLLLLASAGTWYYGRSFMAWRQAALGSDAKETLDLQTAVQHYERALVYDPNFPEAYSKLGDIYSTYGNLPSTPENEAARKQMLEHATYMYSESLELNPFQSDVIVRLAVAYERAGDNDAALTAFTAAQEIDPHNAFTLFRLGLFYKNLGELKKAEEAFTRSHQLNFWSDQGAKLNIEELLSPEEVSPEEDSPEEAPIPEEPE